jgi:hypothetical protein
MNPSPWAPRSINSAVSSTSAITRGRIRCESNQRSSWRRSALESPKAWQAKDPLPRWLAEVAFGARYLLKRFDLIADHLPEIGLADDAQLLARILARNHSGLSHIWAGFPPDRGIGASI